MDPTTRIDSGKSIRSACVRLALIMAASIACYAQTDVPGKVVEFSIDYPNEEQLASSHQQCMPMDPGTPDPHMRSHLTEMVVRSSGSPGKITTRS